MLDLANLRQYKENNRLEAKRAQGGLPHSIWETSSAFANTFGGYILLGVIENAGKSFSSVPLPDPERLAADFWNGVNNRAVTNVNILSDQNVQIRESEGNRIVVIEVPRADRHDKPVYIGSDPFAGTYRRNGERDYRCTREEALANALIHAGYYDRRGLVVQKWTDRIRITNPGAFRINVQEALVGGVSDPRNESLIKMFNLINVGERAGSGLPSIRAVWQKQRWKTPEITESFGPDRTTLLPLVSEKMAIHPAGLPSSAKWRFCST